MEEANSSLICQTIGVSQAPQIGPPAVIFRVTSMIQKPSQAQNPPTLVPFPQSRPNRSFVTLTSFATRVGHFCWLALYASPHDLHGTAKVDQDLKKDANLTALILTTSTFVNTAGFAPFLWMVLGPVAIPCLLLVNYASNAVGVIAARYTPENRRWSNVGLGTFVLLNLFLTAFTGTGAVLFQDAPRIQRTQAAQIIETQRQRLARLAEASPDLKTLRQEIADQEAKQAELQREFPENYRDLPEWQRHQVELFGVYADRNLPLSVRKESLKEREQRLSETAVQPYQEAVAELNRKLQKQIELGDDIQFLKAEMPRQYAANFNTDGSLKSSADAATIANQLFFDYLLTGKISQLVLPMVAAGLSVILSGAACYLAYAFARRPDVQRSRDPQERALLKEAILRLSQPRPSQDD
jgi:hypothetical protein